MSMAPRIRPGHDTNCSCDRCEIERLRERVDATIDTLTKFADVDLWAKGNQIDNLRERVERLEEVRTSEIIASVESVGCKVTSALNDMAARRDPAPPASSSEGKRLGMVFAVEAWAIPMDGDEEPCETEMHDSQEFADESQASKWAFARMEEGFLTRLWRRTDRTRTTPPAEERRCVCGHVRTNHQDDRDPVCNVVGCECTNFRLPPAEGGTGEAWTAAVPHVEGVYWCKWIDQYGHEFPEEIGFLYLDPDSDKPEWLWDTPGSDNNPFVASRDRKDSYWFGPLLPPKFPSPAEPVTPVMCERTLRMAIKKFAEIADNWQTEGDSKIGPCQAMCRLNAASHDLAAKCLFDMIGTPLPTGGE